MKRLYVFASLLSVAVLALASLPLINAQADDTDMAGPAASAVTVAPDSIVVNDSVTVTATVDDSATGGSNIQSAEFSLNGGGWMPLEAADGNFDSATEDVTGSFIASLAGDNEVCVRGTDAQGNVGDATCAAFSVQAVDTEGPVTSAVTIKPDPATVNDPVTVAAAVDDSAIGGSNIQSAEVSLNGGDWTALDASDGAFDSVAENVTGAVVVTQPGDNEVCVRGTDAAGNVGEASCVTFSAQYAFAFDGFFPPVRMGQDNRANAPQAIPVKWRLTLTQDGSAVSDPASFIALESYAVDCATLAGDPSTAVVEGGPGKSGLQYLGDGNWLFNWKTSKAYGGTCRMVFVLFSDGQMSPAVLFRFR